MFFSWEEDENECVKGKLIVPGRKCAKKKSWKEVVCSK